jgi:uncharacterized protein (DUF433 family)
VRQEHRIVRHAKICSGESGFPGVAGLRFVVLASLADGDSIDDILADFPALKTEDVQGAMRLRGGCQRKEDLPVPATPHIR